MKEEIFVAFCSKCGTQINDNSVFCPNCGAQIRVNNHMPTQAPYGYQNNYANMQNENDVPNTGLKVLSLLIPLVGLILYLVYSKEKPVSAKAYGKFALIGFNVAVILTIVLTACVIIFIASNNNATTMIEYHGNRFY